VDRNLAKFNNVLPRKKFHLWRELIAPPRTLQVFCFLRERRAAGDAELPNLRLDVGTELCHGHVWEIVNQGVPDRFVEILRGLDGPNDEGSDSPGR
jgi:hypothetical protein